MENLEPNLQRGEKRRQKYAVNLNNEEVKRVKNSSEDIGLMLQLESVFSVDLSGATMFECASNNDQVAISLVIQDFTEVKIISKTHSAIFSVQVEGVVKSLCFSQRYLVAGTTNGTIYIISNDQILNKRQLSNAISKIYYCKDNNLIYIITYSEDETHIYAIDDQERITLLKTDETVHDFVTSGQYIYFINKNFVLFQLYKGQMQRQISLGCECKLASSVQGGLFAFGRQELFEIDTEFLVVVKRVHFEREILTISHLLNKNYTVTSLNKKFLLFDNQLKLEIGEFDEIRATADGSVYVTISNDQMIINKICLSNDERIFHDLISTKQFEKAVEYGRMKGKDLSIVFEAELNSFDVIDNDSLDRVLYIISKLSNVNIQELLHKCKSLEEKQIICKEMQLSRMSKLLTTQKMIGVTGDHLSPETLYTEMLQKIDLRKAAIIYKRHENEVSSINISQIIANTDSIDAIQEFLMETKCKAVDEDWLKQLSIEYFNAHNKILSLPFSNNNYSREFLVLRDQLKQLQQTNQEFQMSLQVQTLNSVDFETIIIQQLIENIENGDELLLELSVVEQICDGLQLDYNQLIFDFAIEKLLQGKIELIFEVVKTITDSQLKQKLIEEILYRLQIPLGPDQLMFIREVKSNELIQLLLLKQKLFDDFSITDFSVECLLTHLRESSDLSLFQLLLEYQSLFPLHFPHPVEMFLIKLKQGYMDFIELIPNEYRDCILGEYDMWKNPISNTKAFPPTVPKDQRSIIDYLELHRSLEIKKIISNQKQRYDKKLLKKTQIPTISNEEWYFDFSLMCDKELKTAQELQKYNYNQLALRLIDLEQSDDDDDQELRNRLKETVLTLAIERNDLILTVGYSLAIQDHQLINKLLKQKMKTIDENDFYRLKQLASIGELLNLNNQMLSQQFKRLSINCKWWLLFQQISVDVDQHKFRHSQDYLFHLMFKLLIFSDFELLKEFCVDYSLDIKDLEFYFNQHLILTNQTPSPCQDWRLFDDVVSPYNYECIEGLLKDHQQYLLLLKELKKYPRKSLPSSLECDLVQQRFDALNKDLSPQREFYFQHQNKRLPFHFIIKNPQDILRTELKSLDDCQRFQPFVQLFQLSFDQLLLLVLKNIKDLQGKKQVISKLSTIDLQIEQYFELSKTNELFALKQIQSLSDRHSIEDINVQGQIIELEILQLLKQQKISIERDLIRQPLELFKTLILSPDFVSNIDLIKSIIDIYQLPHHDLFLQLFQQILSTRFNINNDQDQLLLSIQYTMCENEQKLINALSLILAEFQQDIYLPKLLDFCGNAQNPLIERLRCCQLLGEKALFRILLLHLDLKQLEIPPSTLVNTSTIDFAFIQSLLVYCGNKPLVLQLVLLLCLDLECGVSDLDLIKSTISQLTFMKQFKFFTFLFRHSFDNFPLVDEISQAFLETCLYLLSNQDSLVFDLIILSPVYLTDNQWITIYTKLNESSNELKWKGKCLLLQLNLIKDLNVDLTEAITDQNLGEICKFSSNTNDNKLLQTVFEKVYLTDNHELFTNVNYRFSKLYAEYLINSKRHDRLLEFLEANGYVKELNLLKGMTFK